MRTVATHSVTLHPDEFVRTVQDCCVALAFGGVCSSRERARAVLCTSLAVGVQGSRMPVTKTEVAALFSAARGDAKLGATLVNVIVEYLVDTAEVKEIEEVRLD